MSTSYSAGAVDLDINGGSNGNTVNVCCPGTGDDNTIHNPLPLILIVVSSFLVLSASFMALSFSVRHLANTISASRLITNHAKRQTDLERAEPYSDTDTTGADQEVRWTWVQSILVRSRAWLTTVWLGMLAMLAMCGCCVSPGIELNLPVHSTTRRED
ncbi:hypothetical protein C8Q76DRAFT_698309 [Earliella scabrosa]|nr:hypothetical protein C8Q76DRAFT_698309 [Earliella scabrosa]